MAQIKATIFFERQFWVGSFERTDKEGYSIARNVFGKEPTDVEIYEFVLHQYDTLDFGPPEEFKLEIKRMNPKRLAKLARREMKEIKKTGKTSTIAQDYMRKRAGETKKAEGNKLSSRKRVTGKRTI